MSAALLNQLCDLDVVQLFVPERRATAYALLGDGSLGQLLHPNRPRTFFARMVKDYPRRHVLDCVIFRDGTETPIITITYETLSTNALWCLLVKYGMTADQRAVERLLSVRAW